MSSTVLLRMPRMLHLYVVAWACVPSVGRVAWSMRRGLVGLNDAQKAAVVVLPLFVAALMLCCVPPPAAHAPLGSKRKGTVQRLLRVRSNGWVCLLALWTAAPRALLQAEVFGHASATSAYVIAASVGAIANGAVACWIRDGAAVGRGLAFQVVLVGVGTAPFCHGPTCVVAATGWVLGSIETTLLALLMRVNADQDRVTMAVLVAATTSLGACLSRIACMLLLGTPRPTDVFAPFALVVWVTGFGLLLGAAYAIKHDSSEEQSIALVPPTTPARLEALGEPRVDALTALR